MAKKKYIHIYQCKRGYVLADDIFDDCGILIMSKDTVLDEQGIKKIKSFGVRQLSVYEHQSSHDRFMEDYRENIDIMKQLLGDLEAGRKPDYEKVDYVCNSIFSAISSISNIIECMNRVKNIDEYIYTHSINVSVYAMLIARWLGFQEGEIKNIIITGVLHDIGKSKIPVEILNKKGPLLPEEYEQVKHHADIGYQISEDIPELTDDIRKGILMHHEREDGKGYPYGVSGDKISMYSKIISVADVYDALTSEKVYKRRITPFDTFGELVRIGYGYFDTKVLMTFLSNISSYYIGATVKMNSGEKGRVIFVSPQSITTPIVFVNDRYIDLSKDKQYKIVEML